MEAFTPLTEGVRALSMDNSSLTVMGLTLMVTVVTVLAVMKMKYDTMQRKGSKVSPSALSSSHTNKVQPLHHNTREHHQHHQHHNNSSNSDSGISHGGKTPSRKSRGGRSNAQNGQKQHMVDQWLSHRNNNRADGLVYCYDRYMHASCQEDNLSPRHNPAHRNSTSSEETNISDDLHSHSSSEDLSSNAYTVEKKENGKKSKSRSKRQQQRQRKKQRNQSPCDDVDNGNDNANNSTNTGNSNNNNNIVTRMQVDDDPKGIRERKSAIEMGTNAGQRNGNNNNNNKSQNQQNQQHSRKQCAKTAAQKAAGHKSGGNKASKVNKQQNNAGTSGDGRVNPLTNSSSSSSVSSAMSSMSAVSASSLSLSSMPSSSNSSAVSSPQSSPTASPSASKRSGNGGHNGGGANNKNNNHSRSSDNYKNRLARALAPYTTNDYSCATLFPSMTEAELAEQLRRYVIDPNLLRVYGFPVESAVHEGCIEIYKCLPKPYTKQHKRCNKQKQQSDVINAHDGLNIAAKGTGTSGNSNRSGDRPWQTVDGVPSSGSDSGQCSVDSSPPAVDSDLGDVAEDEAPGATVFYTPDGTYQIFSQYDKSTEKQCVRCASHFYVTDEGEYLQQEECIYHWGKLYSTYTPSQGTTYQYTCCQRKEGEEGCARHSVHVWTGAVVGLNGPYTDFHYTRPRYDLSQPVKVYALDCEMSYTGRGLEVTKVTVVAYDGQIVYEHFVLPPAEIVDYNTRFSGVAESDLFKNGKLIPNKVKTLKEVQHDLLQLFDAETLIIGHGLDNDLRVLRIVHKNIVDTSVAFPHTSGFPYRRALRNLTRVCLNRDIQSSESGHSSLEDSRAALDLMLWRLKQDLQEGEGAKNASGTSPTAATTKSSMHHHNHQHHNNNQHQHHHHNQQQKHQQPS